MIGLHSWNISIPIQMPARESLHVDLGCGHSPRNPLRAQMVVGVDIQEFCEAEPCFPFEYQRIEPGDRLPFMTSSVDSVSGFDFLEHVPRFDRRPDGISFNPFIELMNEIYRVLKPGGILLAVTPAFPSPSAFVDPTHVNIITAETHGYFCEPDVLARRLGYGFEGSFDAVAVQWLKRWSPVWKECPSDPETRFGPWSGLIRLLYEGSFDYRHRLKDLWRDVGSKEHLLWVFKTVK